VIVQSCSATGRVRRLRAEVAESATEGREAVRMVADTARRLPGVEAFEGQLRGAAVRARDLPIADYDALNVAKVTARLPELSQAELGTVPRTSAGTASARPCWSGSPPCGRMSAGRATTH